MNGKRAKQIRKVVYQGEKEEPVHERGYSELFGGTIVSTGTRAEYQRIKKDYKRLRQQGKVPLLIEPSPVSET